MVCFKYRKKGEDFLYVFNLYFWEFDFNSDKRVVKYVINKYISICKNGIEAEYKLLLEEVPDE